MNEIEGKYFSFRDGKPTGPDVQMLLDRWPDLKPGDRIEYEEISALIGVPYPSVRFRTVTAAWRRKLLAAKVVIDCDNGFAFFVTDNKQRLDKTQKVFTHIARAAHGQRKVVATVVPENTETDEIMKHQAKLLYHVEMEMRGTKRKLLPDTRVTETPRIAPPVVAQDKDGKVH